MPQLILEDKKSRLTGISLATAVALSQKLTFKVPGAEFSPRFKMGTWDGKQAFFERPGNKFDTGLAPIIYKYCIKNKEKLEVVDKRTSQHMKFDKIPKDDIVHIGPKVLRPYQIDAVNSLLQRNIGGVPFNRGIINIATNGGKTTVATAIMSKVLEKLQETDNMLFLVHSKELAFQAQKTIETDLGISCGFLGSGKWEEKQVNVAIIKTLSLKLKDKAFNRLANNCKAVIIDECQHVTSSSYTKVLKKLVNTQVRVGLTGTVPKDKIKRSSIYSIISSPSIKISNSFLIEQGASAKPVCYFSNCKFPRLDDAMLDYSEIYDQGIVNNTYRNTLIQNIIKKEFPQGNVLIVVDRKEHGDIITEIANNIPGVGRVEFTHGARSTGDRLTILQDLKDGNINVLVATSILDEGVDADNINSIINARGLKSARVVLQVLGRGLRLKKDGSGLRYYDFTDYSSNQLLEHSLERVEILSKEGFELVELL